MVADRFTARKIFLTKWTFCLTNWSLSIDLVGTRFGQMRFSQKSLEVQNGFEINLCIVSRYVRPERS
jgi:hypothetical protein